MENQDYIVYTYRYIWKNKDSDRFVVNVVTGQEQEHKNFMARLCADENVELASRIYVCEMNLLYVEQYETIKAKEA